MLCGPRGANLHRVGCQNEPGGQLPLSTPSQEPREPGEASVNPSLSAEQDLLTRLQGLASSGTFEAHVTVEAFGSAERERFRGVCAALGVKSVLIELPEGTTRSQPMTSSYHHGELAEVVREVAHIARTLREEGFPVT